MKNQKAVTAVAAATKSSPSHYNQQRMIELWSKGKSIQAIAQDQKCSTIWARRVLAKKAPEQYRLGLEARHTTAALAGPVAVVKRAGRSKDFNIGQAVEIIARAVASAAFSDAQLVPQPTTRTQMFENISKGVRAGVRSLGIGFHA